MLFIPEDIADQLRELTKELPSDLAGTANRMLELWPSSALAREMLAASAASTGNPERAEPLLWEALHLSPCTPRVYMTLAALFTNRNQADAMGKRMRHLALWKLALSSSIPEAVAAHFEAAAGAEAHDPATYETLARFEDIAGRKIVDPPEVAERLLPFRLLNDVQRDTAVKFQPETLEAILKHAAVCAPLFRNALRQWGADPDALDGAALCLLIAILGEIAEADTVDELLELTESGSEFVFLHTNWAIYRLGQRLPEAVFARFRALRGRSPLRLRCAMADQVNLLPDVDGDVAFLAELLEDFDAAGNPEEAGYLLALVAHALREREQDELAKFLVERYQDRLPREQRLWLEDALNGEDGLASFVVREGIDSMSIEDVCLERMLLQSAHEEVEEDEEAEEEFDEEDLVVVPPRPGRNEPCWCGSGKKYKKCHLAQDEEDDREHAAAAAGEEPVSLRLLVMRDVFTASSEWLRKNDLRKARHMYFNGEEDSESSDEEALRFSEWLLFDFRDANTRHTAVENYPRTRATSLTRAEREILESFRDSRFSVFQVGSVEPASGVHVRDLCRGELLFLHDAAPGELAQGDALVARVQHLEGRWIFAAEWLPIPRAVLDPLMAALTEESRVAGQGLAEFVRGQGHRLHRMVKQLAKEQ